MALFYVAKSTKKSPPETACQQFIIQDLDYQGLGVAKINGKTWFVEDALPNEHVKARIIEEKRQYGRAQTVNIFQSSSIRQTPSCAQYHKCGGCQMQHIPLSMQRETKQKALFQRLQKLQSTPIQFESMIAGADKHYRRRAKFSIAWQNKQLIVGFRQRNSQYIIPISYCEILENELNSLLPILQTLLSQWQTPRKLGHLELVKADNGIALLLRHIGEISEKDRKNLLKFAQSQQIMLFVMCDKEQIEQWWGGSPYYQISELKLYFSIRDFIQVNAPLNQKMVETALNWLDLKGNERVLDLFCGMGNFTLPVALHAKTVVGVEGVAPMVEQARANAKQNGIHNVEFYQTDLDQPFIEQPWAKAVFDKVLLDPARNGALFCLEHLCALNPSHIVYVSCNPATLVRDAEKLINNGYRLVKSAMIDMFPHTGHLESISLFMKPI